MSGRSLSTRELVLVGVLATAAVIVGWSVVRGKALSAEVTDVEGQLVAARKSFDKASSELTRISDESLTGRERAQLEREVVEATAELAAARTRLDGLEGRFVDVASSGGLQSLRQRLSELVERHELEVIESMAHRRTERRVTPMQSRLVNGDYDRPLHKLRVRSGFDSLRAFLLELPDLDERVVVVRFATEVDEERVDEGLLVSDFLLAL